MRGQSVFGGVAVAVLLAVVGCSDDVGITVTERFTATLNGTNEKPNAVTTTATGTAEFTYVADIPALFYRIDVAGIDSATVAHIHGPADINNPAGVIVNLFLGPTKPIGFTGALAEGVVGQLGAPVGMTMDSLLVLLRTGNAYVNVHTRVNLGGEIRGQVSRQ